MDSQIDRYIDRQINGQIDGLIGLTEKQIDMKIDKF